MKSFTRTLGVIGAIAAAILNLSNPCAASSVTFLSLQDARTAVMNDSSYFLSMNIPEMNAKLGKVVSGSSLYEMQRNCMNTYAGAVLAFTDSEMAYIQRIISQFDDSVEAAYPILGRVPWSFYKIANEIEAGLPHTDGRHIILPQWFCDSLNAVIPTMKEGTFSAMAFCAQNYSMLAHEKVHLTQSAFGESFDSLYQQLWQFRKDVGPLDLSALLKHRILNPDARSENWITNVISGAETLTVHPMLLLDGVVNEVPIMPNDFQEIAVCLKQTDGKWTPILDSAGSPVTVPLQDLPDYHLRFRSVGRNPFDESSADFAEVYAGIYHPDEIVADIFDEIVLVDLFDLEDRLPKEQIEYFRRNTDGVRDWFRRPIQP